MFYDFSVEIDLN